MDGCSLTTAEEQLLRIPLSKQSFQQLEQYTGIGNRILQQGSQYAHFSGKDDLALLLDLSAAEAAAAAAAPVGGKASAAGTGSRSAKNTTAAGTGSKTAAAAGAGSLKLGGVTYTRLEVSLDGDEAFGFRGDGAPEFTSSEDVRLLRKVAKVPLLGVSHNFKGTKRVFSPSLRVLCGTQQGILMAWADLFFAVHPDSLKDFKAPDGFSLCGLSYRPSQLRFFNTAGHSFLDFDSHRDVQLTGGVMWNAGLHTDMHVTVQDMLRLVQVARLELTVAGASSRSIEHRALLRIEHLTDSSYIQQQLLRRPGLKPPPGEALIDPSNRGPEEARLQQLARRAAYLTGQPSSPAASQLTEGGSPAASAAAVAALAAAFPVAAAALAAAFPAAAAAISRGATGTKAAPNAATAAQAGADTDAVVGAALAKAAAKAEDTAVTAPQTEPEAAAVAMSAAAVAEGTDAAAGTDTATASGREQADTAAAAAAAAVPHVCEAPDGPPAKRRKHQHHQQQQQQQQQQQGMLLQSSPSPDEQQQHPLHLQYPRRDPRQHQQQNTCQQQQPHIVKQQPTEQQQQQQQQQGRRQERDPRIAQQQPFEHQQQEQQLSTSPRQAITGQSEAAVAQQQQQPQLQPPDQQLQPPSQLQPSQQPPWQLISACDELGNGRGAALMRSDGWAAVPQQLQEKLCDAFPVGLTCCSWVAAASSSGSPLLLPAAGGGGDGGTGGGSGSSRKVGVKWEAFTGSSTPPAAAVAAVHVLDALGRSCCIGGVEAPVLLHMCGSSSSSSSRGPNAAAALCVDLLLLLAEDGMPQADLDSLAGKLAVKVSDDVTQAQAADRKHPGSGGTAAVLQQWAARVDAIVGLPAVQQQQLQLERQDKLGQMCLLLDLPWP